MESIKPPKTLKFYSLMRMSTTSTGYNISMTATSTSNNIGSGLFHTLQEAEHYRTMEILKDVTNTSSFHIFELDFPNPAYKE
jgi:hypothetical protein